MEDRRLLTSISIAIITLPMPFTGLLLFSCVPRGIGSPFPVIKPKFIGVASNLNPVAVRVEKTDRAVAGDFQNLRAANNGDFSTLERRKEVIDFLVGSDIDAEVM